MARNPLTRAPSAWDRWLPAGLAVGSLLAGSWLAARDAAVRAPAGAVDEPGWLLGALAEGLDVAFLSAPWIAAWLILPWADGRGRRRRRAAWTGLVVLGLLVLASGVAAPWGVRRTGTVEARVMNAERTQVGLSADTVAWYPGDTRTWHPTDWAVAAVSRITDGDESRTSSQVAMSAWSGLGVTLAALAWLLAFVGGRRMRWPWWIVAPYPIACVLGASWFLRPLLVPLWDRDSLWIGGLLALAPAVLGGVVAALARRVTGPAPRSTEAASPVDAPQDTTTEAATRSVPPRRRRALAAAGTGLLAALSLAAGNELVRGESLTLPDRTSEVSVAHLELTLLDGGTLALAEHRGRPLVLTKWASWCGPCRRELPALEALQAELGDDVLFVAINVDEDDETIRNFADETGLSLPVARDDEATKRMLPQAGLPTTWIVGPDLIVRHRHVGYGPGVEDELRHRLQLLAEESEASATSGSPPGDGRP